MGSILNRLLAAAVGLVGGLSVLAQGTQVDISAADLLAGRADATLRELGARAAAEGLAVTVSAPVYWKDRIVAALEADTAEVELDLTYRETIVESVLVRLQPPDGASAAADRAQQEPAATRAGPAPAAPAADTSELDRAAARLKQEARELVISQADIPSTAELLARSAPAGLERPTGEPPVGPAPVSDPEPTDTGSLAPAEAEAPAQAPETGVVDEAGGAPVAEPPPSPQTEPPAQAPAAVAVVDEEAAPAEPTAVDRAAAARASLIRRLNDGEPIDRQLTVGQLRRGDLVFTTGGVLAVVRGSAVGHDVYWLMGDLNLEQNSLRRLQAGKYRVLRRPEVPRERVEQSSVAAADPDITEPGDERRAMERRYNEGRPIEATVSAAGLLPDDVLLVGDGEILVVRRTRVGMRRFWLEGELDLEREELEPNGTRKYRVSRVIRD